LNTPNARADENTFDFALIGDLPYNPLEREHLASLLDSLKREELAFVVHDGDFKSGSSACSDPVFDDRLALFNQSPHPFIFVPGDNDWLDCKRKNNGEYDPLERLQALRNRFFKEPVTLGQRRFALETQANMRGFSERREHLRWRTGPVLFITLNVPGDDNNFGSGPSPSQEFSRRSAAIENWIERGFDEARQKGLKAVVIIMQASPDFSASSKTAQPSGFKSLVDQLRRETLAFSGEVLLVHGDTHLHTQDQPLLHLPGSPHAGKPVKNFTRVSTWGSPFIGWLKVKVRADQTSPTLFRIESNLGLGG
jgi:hypothetical protein